MLEVGMLAVLVLELEEMLSVLELEEVLSVLELEEMLTVLVNMRWRRRPADSTAARIQFVKACFPCFPLM